MKPIEKKSKKKRAFTIIELLTIMSIIVILISLLVPALTRVKRYAKRVKQKAQFHSISVALDLYNAEFDGYPPSDELDLVDDSYCGAMKLAEAMVGQDLLGFHPDSSFRNDLTADGTGLSLYATMTYTPPPTNRMARRGPYLELGNANAYRIKNIYGADNITNSLDGDRYVLCDVYDKVRLRSVTTDPEPANRISGKTGMPILYYRADTSKTTHNINDKDDTQNIYNYKDNDELVQLGMPFDPSGLVHLMDSTGGDTRHDLPDDVADALIFYVKQSGGAIEDPRTLNVKVALPGMYRPQRADSYILLSAGFDGEYGTPDDIFNFER